MISVREQHQRESSTIGGEPRSVLRREEDSTVCADVGAKRLWNRCRAPMPCSMTFNWILSEELVMATLWKLRYAICGIVLTLSGCASSHGPGSSADEAVSITAEPFFCVYDDALGRSVFWFPTERGCVAMRFSAEPDSGAPLHITHADGAWLGVSKYLSSVVYDTDVCTETTDSDAEALELQSGELALRAGRDDAGNLRPSSVNAVWRGVSGETFRIQTDNIHPRSGCR